MEACSVFGARAGNASCSFAESCTMSKCVGLHLVFTHNILAGCPKFFLRHMVIASWEHPHFESIHDALATAIVCVRLLADHMDTSDSSS